MRYSALVVCSVFCASALAGDYTTYIGDAFPYHVAAITVDGAGNTYLTGSRAITTQAPGVAPLTDVFITKLDISGNIAKAVTLSGKGSDQGNSIAVDSSGNVWVAGITSSADFPLHNPLQASLGPESTGFLTKIAPDGTMLFSTYLGGTKGASTLNAVAVDAQGNAYVTGASYASDYPRTVGLPAGDVATGPGAVETAFFAKISSDGDTIVYAGGVSAKQRACGTGSSCFLSALTASGVAVAVDSSGNAYIAGNAGGTGLSTTSGALRTDGIGAFVMKVNPSGTGLVYLTMLGLANYIPGGVAPGSNPGNTVMAIAADAAGNAYITGATSDPDFPATASVPQPTFSIPASQINPFEKPPSDAFVAKLNPSGTAMVWATFLGGAAADQGQSIAVDPSDNVWVSGTTSSSDFPVSGSAPLGPEFLVEFNASASARSYGARFPANIVASSIALDSSSAVHAAGSTGIVSTLTSSQMSAPRLFGIENAAGGVLAGRIAPGELISLYGQHFGVANPTLASFDSAGFLPNTLAGVQITIAGASAALLYVSDTQINAVVPMGLASPGSTQVDVILNGSSLPGLRAAIDHAAPQVFRNPDGSAASINQDGSVNSAVHPAPIGSIVAIWATGTGGFSGADGQRATSAQFTCSCAIQTRTDSLYVTYSGTAPGLVNGITQVNFQIPSSPNAGTVESFYLGASGKTSDQTSVYVSR